MNAEQLPLWEEQATTQTQADPFLPWLDLYLLPEHDARGKARGAVLVCPGGGYAGRAPHEQEPIAAAYNAAGFHAFVVQYRVAPNRHPAPLLDVSRAMRLIRHNAEKWQVDPEHIAVCGFSAGGHLAASIGVHYALGDLNTGDKLDEISCRPDGLILCYPVISSGAFAHLGSFQNLLGPDPDPELLALMSLETQVTGETPPAFLWHTAEDAGVPVENSLSFARALNRAGVPFELHVYPKGRHGLGLAHEDPHVATWMDLSIQWLREMGWS
jgi:acetyl esterase/lipase